MAVQRPCGNLIEQSGGEEWFDVTLADCRAKKADVQRLTYLVLPSFIAYRL